MNMILDEEDMGVLLMLNVSRKRRNMEKVGNVEKVVRRGAVECHCYVAWSRKQTAGSVLHSGIERPNQRCFLHWVSNQTPLTNAPLTPSMLFQRYARQTPYPSR
jgi:hypothetical protein